MSFSFDEHITLGLVSSNVKEAAFFGSTLDETYVRYLTNQDLANPGAWSSDGVSIGVSNQTLFVGRASNGEPYGKVFNARYGRVGVGSEQPWACLDVQSTGSESNLVFVHGSAGGGCFYVAAGGAVGIGTTAPRAAWDMYAAPARASDVAFQVRSATASNPAIQVTYDGHVGIGTASSSNYALAVGGGMLFDSATLPFIRTDSLTPSSNDFVRTGPLWVVGSSSNLSVSSGGLAIGVSVDQGVVASAYLSVSDQRAKHDIVAADPLRDLQAVMAIEPKRFKLNGRTDEMCGFLAQDVERVVTNAVHVGRGRVGPGETTIDDFRYLDNQQLIPVLWNAVRALAAEVANCRLRSDGHGADQVPP